MKKLIVGCGYLGQRVAAAWLTQGDKVLAVTRSATRARELEAAGIQPIVGDVTADLDLREADGVGHVLFAVGFDRGSGKEIRDVYVGGLQKVLDELPQSVTRFTYISSTGVYGQADGAWVDEDSPCEPQREGGRACLAAERLLSSRQIEVRRVILRLAGIYGPGRLPKLQDLLAGKPIDSPAHGFLNLIHVDDGVNVILATEKLADPPARMLVSDGEPVLRGDFYRELAKLSGAGEPRFAEPSDSPTSGRRASTDKRIDNRIMQELDLQLRYPSYREGLKAVLAQS